MTVARAAWALLLVVGACSSDKKVEPTPAKKAPLVETKTTPTLAAPSKAPTAARKPLGIDPLEGKFTLAQALDGLARQGELRARFETNQGEVVIKLFEKEAPNTIANFVGLARGKRAFEDVTTGKWVLRPFYDGLTFHRVVPYFMVETGCPSGNGLGTPGYHIPDEFHDALKHDKPGIVGMTNAGPNTGGSQFYITERPAPNLDKRHSVFGEVIEGMDVLKKIARMPRDNDKPKEAVVITKLTIFRG